MFCLTTFFYFLFNYFMFPSFNSFIFLLVHNYFEYYEWPLELFHNYTCEVALHIMHFIMLCFVNFKSNRERIFGKFLEKFRKFSDKFFLWIENKIENLILLLVIQQLFWIHQDTVNKWVWIDDIFAEVLRKIWSIFLILKL